MRDKARKPGVTRLQYGEQLAREQGTITRDWGGKLPLAIIYPNSYYLGMSNLGIHAIYRLLNSYPHVLGERVFREKESLAKKQPPLSVESRRPLTDFAVLAFSVSYELDYFNIPGMLKAAGIPLLAAERDESHPLIIAGGPCVIANPMPLSPFFDAFGIGEAEAILPGLLPVLSAGIGGRREDLLKTISSLPGMYVPAYTKTTVTRQWLRNLDDYPANSVILTPDTELGDLFLMEVERGCNWGCRFCLVNTAFAPMRYRSVKKLLEQAGEGLQYRQRIGLMGPAISDHPQIEELLAGLTRMGAELSMSSLRIGSLSENIMKELARGKMQTVTIAPEAGSQRLRQVIKKGICEDDILQVASRVAGQNIRQLKLYFIIGLPTETDADVEEIARLTLAVKNTLLQHRSHAQLTVNVAPFTPKAGTPFQWLPMAPLPVLNRRLSLLKKSLPVQGIKLNAESPSWSQVQGVLALGDAKVGAVLADMEEMSLSGWRKAVEKNHLDIDYYVNNKRDINEKLPWGIISSGTKLEHLERELEKALGKQDSI